MRIIESIFLFIATIMLQLFLFNNIQISGYLNIIIYPLLLILLPIKIRGLWLLLSGLLLGVVADMIEGTEGVFTITFIFLAFLRPTLLKIFLRRDLLDVVIVPISNAIGVAAFLQYTFWVNLLMFLIVIFLERFSFEHISFILLKLGISTIVSTYIIYVIQLPLNRVNKG